MKIGIIGTGNMGRALGTGWAKRGHDVVFGSRDAAKASATAKAAGPTARGGTFDDAAAHGDVVLYTLRDVLPTKLLADAGVLTGRVLIDCNNSDFLDLRKATFPPVRPGESIAEKLAQDVPAARVVKAFNTLPAQVLLVPPEILRRQRVSVFVAGNDPAARATVRQLAEDLGLVAWDSGELDRGYLVETLADFLRFQIAAQGLGMYATLSLGIVDPEGGAR